MEKEGKVCRRVFVVVVGGVGVVVMGWGGGEGG